MSGGPRPWRFRWPRLPGAGRGRRWALVGAGLLIFYALVGFFLLPAVARPQIEKQASALLKRPVTLARLRINPFTFAASAEGLSITDRDKTPLLRWVRLVVNFDPLISLFRREWCFAQIHLVGAGARLVIAPDGKLNIDEIIQSLESSSAPREPSGPLPAVRVRRLRIEDTTVSFVDRSLGETFTSVLGPLRVDLKDFTTVRDERNAYSFRGRTESGESFSWSGQFSLDPIRSNGEFSLQGIPLGKYHPYYRGTVPFDIGRGTADVRSRYQFLWGPVMHEVRLVDAAVQVRDLQLSEHLKNEVAVDAPRTEIEGANFDLLTTALSVDRFAAHGGKIILRQSADGRVNLLDMVLPFFQGTTITEGKVPARPAVPSRAPASGAPPSPKVHLKEMHFDDFTVDAEDLKPPRPVRLHLDRIQLKLLGVDNIPGSAGKGTLDLRWNGEGTVHTDGALSLVGLTADLAVKLDGIDATPLGPYIEPSLDMRLKAGTFSAEGRAHADLFDFEHPEFAFTGDARLDGFDAVDGAKSEEFMRWRSVRMTKTDYSLREDRLRIGDLTIVGAEGRLARAADGTINLFTVLRIPMAPAEAPEGSGSTDAAAPAPPAPAEASGSEAGAPATTGASSPSRATSSPSSAASADASPAPSGTPAASPKAAAPSTVTAVGDTRVGHARIVNSRIRILDRGVTPPVNLAISHIEGTLAGLSSRPGARADVHVTALFDDTAPVTMEGKVDPLGADVYTDLALLARGVDLGPLGPYSETYLGYALDRARLDLEMRYKLEHRIVQGTNLFTADPFLLGQKTESPEATKLPVKLGLALLRDRHGVIRLDVPIEGSLDDPRFRLGRVILHALVNVFTKLVTSPFTLLARAFSGGKDVDLSVIDFAPGGAALSDDSRSRLDTLLKALQERPGLTLTIAGAADPAADPAGLKRARLEGLVRAEKWSSMRRRDREETPVEKVVVTPEERPKVVKGAWKTFRESQPAAAREPKPETPEEMETWIMERIEVGPGDLAALGGERARAVRDYLAAGGIESGRLFLKDQPGAEGSRVSLTLQ